MPPVRRALGNLIRIGEWDPTDHARYPIMVARSGQQRLILGRIVRRLDSDCVMHSCRLQFRQ
ncbi:Uncharacterised protein [Mycobacterium tuberculosis]|uniref:Uncharacterized protein n=1 Tax=Mycobacterium tuberculosis TaxID=1773 RepID=A0A655A329_MYCTX|nr:hypothetical protein RN10_2525 [Mycobacterium tuberculosis]CFD29789.1 Uncharacterised protein [Mycobacterium tuberculosis]CFE39578.1 Uncharacterised protein [Mycobacterium tuberculosis]CFH55807.1 Uncharacterised protein [Mycobacterium tuberculosis]CFH65486.1 Uncharacterised protein [Mycobacterium tuberculosis]